MTVQPAIDLDADVWEGFDAADAAILPLIDPADTVCGLAEARCASSDQRERLAAMAGVLS